MNKTLRKRVSGALYGLLIGDALGCPAEGMSEADIADRFGLLNDMQITEPHYRPAGLHSDDGQQAICLIDAMVFGGDAPAEVFAKLLVDLLVEGSKGYRRFGLHRGTGANFRRTVMALKQGQEFKDAANVTAGNGAAMRIAPVAIFHRDNKEKLLDALLDVSMLTFEALLRRWPLRLLFAKGSNWIRPKTSTSTSSSQMCTRAKRQCLNASTTNKQTTVFLECSKRPSYWPTKAQSMIAFNTS